ncbi:LuxR C-terminal-related transcriptional regulator [Patulibacter minatonensis]|uniref:LuxR C-terminal-related transcriptional regulator n=1 Tax=Patulibacter minatonensis TaxID=298163 RepID=UPI000688CFD2|nr:LuxR C-terminal-related transcriptional regulator [Patulibacter minatonensis]
MMREVATTDEDWSVSAEPIRDVEFRSAVEDLATRSAELLREDAPGGAVALDVVGAAEFLEAAGARLTATLRTGRSGERARGSSRDDVVDLLDELRDATGRLRGLQEAARMSAFSRVREAMGLLRGVSTVEQMLARAPVAAARLGFDRTFVSAIEDSYFVPRTCFIDGDTEWEQAVVRAGREKPRRLDRDLLETEMLRRRRPIRVLDAQNDPRVHKEIAEVSMSRSYVAAPVIVQDKVIGFIHADYFGQRKLVGPMDADVLWMFAEAFGFAFERIAYGERITSLRSSFFQTMALAEEQFARATDGEISFDMGSASATVPDGPVVPRRAPMPVASIGHGRSELADLLTKRELEVLRLMAAGATNEGIASRLVISHGTAKTHVKHILRKLRAANRAEAVSRWFQLERGAGGA